MENNKINIENFVTDELTILTKNDPTYDVCIIFNGALHNYPKELIENYFKKIHKKLVEYNIKNIKISFKNITYIDSSGLSTIITWFYNINYLEKEKQYTVNIEYNKSNSVHEISFEMLEDLYPNIVKII